MNTFWLKIAGIVVAIVVVVILIGVFSSNDESAQPSEPSQEPKAKPKTFYDQAEQDKKKFLAKPKPAPDEANNKSATKPTQPTEDQAKQPRKITLYFKELGEIDNIEAERLLNVAVPGRSIGRLPMTGFSLMLQNCRRIIRKWPDSWYAFRAKQMLADMPPRYQTRYNVTKEEIDLSMYTKPRPGTKPFIVGESR